MALCLFVGPEVFIRDNWTPGQVVNAGICMGLGVVE
jgi:hypothetical protein